MLLKITTTHQPATDLGYLLHKNPARSVQYELSFGKVYVFYPEATRQRCTAALLMDVDPVGMVRGKSKARQSGPWDQYVNDRPYVASSLMSVAIARVFAAALKGRCRERGELARTAIPLEAEITVLPGRGGEQFLRGLFEPLGYEVELTRHELEEQYPEWGLSSYYTTVLRKTTTVAELLRHLYVLMPVLDNRKHYYVGAAEVEKLLAAGEGWLASHPEREAIARRYLKYQPSLARQALAQLAEEDQPEMLSVGRTTATQDDEQDLERELSLNEERLGTVLAVLKASGAKSVLDLGCGEGRLLRELLREKQFERIVGLDVSIRSLEFASARLRMDRMPDRQRRRLELMHGSLMYRDRRLEGFDAAAVVEVIEHLDPPRLAAFERVLFECARPGTIVLTTPNREYNVTWENLAPDPSASEGTAAKLRHKDHRFEWTRAEFMDWARSVADRFGYSVRFLPVGPEDKQLGSPTSMAVFGREG